MEEAMARVLPISQDVAVWGFCDTDFSARKKFPEYVQINDYNDPNVMRASRLQPGVIHASD